jgi:hypothetical protein
MHLPLQENVVDCSVETQAMDLKATDTHPAAQREQIRLLRRATVAQRVRLARSLSQSVIELSRRAIRRQHPNLDEHEVWLKFVELHYGSQLSMRLRAYLNRQRP